MKQEAPQPRRSRTGIPAIHGGEHVNYRAGADATRPPAAKFADVATHGEHSLLSALIRDVSGRDTLCISERRSIDAHHH